jgi:hypothetical protein
MEGEGWGFFESQSVRVELVETILLSHRQFRGRGHSNHVQDASLGCSLALLGNSGMSHGR